MNATEPDAVVANILQRVSDFSVPIFKDVADKHKEILDELLRLKDEILSELIDLKSTHGKRKLKSIHEDDDIDGSLKKNRRSVDADESVRNTVFASIEPNDNKTSTPHEKIPMPLIMDVDKSTPKDVDVSSQIKPNIEVEENKRSKRKASVRATSINNKLLNQQLKNKLRRTSSTKSNIYDTTVEEEKENIEELVNINISNVKDVADVELMPPPMIRPTRKKRGTKANKNEKETEDDTSDTEKNSRKSRKKKSTIDVSTESILDDSSRYNTRSTRSSARNISTTQVAEPVEPQKRTRRKPKESGKKTDVIMDNSEVDESSTDKTVIADVVKAEVNETTAPKDSKTDSKSSKFITKENSTEETISPENITISIENTEVKDDKIVIDLTFDKNDPPQETPDDNNVNDKIGNEIETSNKNLNETVVITKSKTNADPPKDKKNEEKESEKSSSQKQIPLDTTITLPTNPLTANCSEIVAVNKDKNILYDASYSLLTDDLSEIEDTPTKNNVSKVISRTKNTLLVSQSPVKRNVKYFEELAGTNGHIDNSNAPARSTRTKTRTVTAKESNTDTVVSKEIPRVQTPESDVKCSSTNETVVKTSKTNVRAETECRVMSEKKQSGKCQLPMPIVAAKPIKNGIKTSIMQSTENLLSPVPAPSHGTSINHLEQHDANHKRFAVNQISKDDQHRKRDEKIRAAALAREAQEKQKLAKLKLAEKEREDRHYQRVQEELRKKRQAQERKAAELEERRRQEEAARKARQHEQREEAKRQHLANTKNPHDLDKLHKKQKVDPSKEIFDTKPVAAPAPKKSLEIFDKLIQDYEDMEENDISDKEREKLEERMKPQWAKGERFDKIIRVQGFIHNSIVDKFYQTREFAPDLKKIFPGIKSSKLQRNSSAVWRTPPRMSKIIE